MRGRRFRKVLTTAVAALATVGGANACTGDPPDTGPRLTVAQLDAALWRADGLGEPWQHRVTDPAATTRPMLTDWCDGVVPREIPSGPQVAQVRLLTRGDDGTDWLDQTALVYPDSAAASAALAGMREQATACPEASAVPAQTIGPGTVMDSHNRTVSVSDFAVRDWNGFVSAISSEYQQADAARGDNRVFVLARGNAVLVITLGTLRLGDGIRMNWAPVVSSIVEPILIRLGTGSAPPSPGG